MAAHAYLNIQEELGKETVRALDAAGLDVRAAYWILDEESQSWRFVIAEATVDIAGPHAVYRKIGQALKGRTSALPLRDISVVSPNDRLVSLVRKAVSTPGDAIVGMWFSGNVIMG